MTQPNPTIVTQQPTAAGGCAGCGKTYPLFAEYERRSRIPSDIVDHLPILNAWARGWLRRNTGKGPYILELGVRSGNSTAAFLAGLEAHGYGQLWSIDINVPDVPDVFYECDHWNFLKADSTSFKARDWVPREIEVLFDDASHEYTKTLKELRLWVPRIRPGGVVLMHDTEWAADNTMGHPPADTPVGQAMTDFCDESGLTWVNRPGCYGLGVMRIPA
jgi:hypothetical protein